MGRRRPRIGPGLRAAGRIPALGGWRRLVPDRPARAVHHLYRQLSGPRREARLFGLPAALCFMTRGDVAVHAAAVDVDGSALLLAAPGRFGKTTLAAAFAGEGFRLLAEDTACYRSIPRPIGAPRPGDAADPPRCP